MISLLALGAALAFPAAAQTERKSEFGQFDIQDPTVVQKPPADKLGQFEIQDAKATRQTSGTEQGGTSQGYTMTPGSTAQSQVQSEGIKSPRDAASGQASGRTQQSNSSNVIMPDIVKSSATANLDPAADLTDRKAAPGPNQPNGLYFEDSVRTAKTASNPGDTGTQSKWLDASSPYLGVKNGGTGPADGASTSRTAPTGADGFMIEMGTTPPTTNLKSDHASRENCVECFRTSGDGSATGPNQPDGFSFGMSNGGTWATQPESTSAGTTQASTATSGQAAKLRKARRNRDGANERRQTKP
ncbi:MAG: hypothetical protein KDE32_09605 [Novosphingobium sp.]|nr:hypothetical protein [Novosphingobium sp.]